MDLAGKICIITGSAQGLGKQFSQRLLQAGARVTISDLRDDQGNKTVEEFQTKFGKNNVHFVACDVTKDDQLENLFQESEKFFQGPVDIFVNNAGINTNLGWRKCMEVNILAVMAATEKAMQRMKGRKDCKIVNVASLAGIVAGMGEESAGYFVSKHGVVSLCRTLAANKKVHGIDILCLCPNWTNTEIVSSVKAELKHEVEKSVKESGGLMQVEDVGNGFMKLIGSPNGTVLAVMAGVPCFDIPDTAMVRTVGTAVVGKLLQKLFGVDLLQTWHVVAVLAVLFILSHIFLRFLLNCF